VAKDLDKNALVKDDYQQMKEDIGEATKAQNTFQNPEDRSAMSTAGKPDVSERPAFDRHGRNKTSETSKLSMLLH
jgi:hypothetical protein